MRNDKPIHTAVRDEAETQMASLLKEEIISDATGTECGLFVEVARLISIIAPTEVNVFICSSVNEDRGHAARRIHELSKRHRYPFVQCDCRELSSEKSGDESFDGMQSGILWSHFDRAYGGTLFLDHVELLPCASQVMMLRALQDRELTRSGCPQPLKVDVRLIAATTCNLAARVKNSDFDADLYFQMNIFPLDITSVNVEHL